MNGEYGYNQLPFASDPPKPDDLLPLVSLDDGVRYCIADDLLLPDDVEEIGSELKSSDFTRFGTFAATVVRIIGSLFSHPRFDLRICMFHHLCSILIRLFLKKRVFRYSAF